MIKDHLALVIMAIVFGLAMVLNFLQMKMVLTVLGLQYVSKLN